MTLVYNLLGLILGILLIWRRVRPATSSSYGSLVWARFRRSRLNRLALTFIGLLFAIALGADFLASDMPLLLHQNGRLYVLPNLTHPPTLRAFNNATLLQGLPEGDWAVVPLIPYGPDEDMSQLNSRATSAPDATHLLGTDDRGRDVASRMIHGSRVTLTVGVLAVGLYAAIGTLLGALAGYFGGRTDLVVSRLTELFLSFPLFFLILTVQALLPTTAGVASVLQLALMLGLTGWTEVSRLVRAEVLRARVQDYVLAARAAGLPHGRILWRYILPNAVSPVLVAATFGVAGAILAESALSFLGFGVQPPMASWGEMLQQAREAKRIWLVVFPGLTIFLTVTAYNLVGEGLRDAMDPRLTE